MEIALSMAPVVCLAAAAAGRLGQGSLITLAAVLRKKERKRDEVGDYCTASCFAPSLFLSFSLGRESPRV